MSKHEGKKIAIKFTENLTGDVEGNATAFTVTGQELLHIGGELVDGDYQVNTVERYPIPKVWNDGLDGETEKTESDNGDLRLFRNDKTTNCLRFNGTNNYVETPYVPNATDLGNGFVLSMEVYWFSNSKDQFTGAWGTPRFYVGNRSGKYQIGIGGAFESTNITPILNTWTHLELRFNGSTVDFYVDEQKVGSFSATFSGIAQNKFGIGRVTGEGRYTEGKIKNVYIKNANNELIACWELNEGQGTTAYDSTANANHGTIYGATWDTEVVLGDYETEGYYVTEKIDIDSDLRIKWNAEIPTDTDIKIEISSDKQNWQEVENGEVINADGIWIKVTLTTDDETVTPVLKELWLEEPEQRQNTILLTMKPLKRFNNVEGKLTVAYDALIGNLTGRGGPVESFEEEFEPVDLVATPNPRVTESISVAPVAVTADLIPVEYPDAFAEETITVAPVSVTAVLTPIDEINP